MGAGHRVHSRIQGNGNANAIHGLCTPPMLGYWCVNPRSTGARHAASVRTYALMRAHSPRTLRELAIDRDVHPSRVDVSLGVTLAELSRQYEIRP